MAQLPLVYDGPLSIRHQTLDLDDKKTAQKTCSPSQKKWWLENSARSSSLPSCIGISFEAAREVGRELDGSVDGSPAGGWRLKVWVFLSTGFLAFFGRAKMGRNHSFWKDMLKASVFFFSKWKNGT